MAIISETLKPSSAEARRSAFFLALVAIDVLAGLADAVSQPYMILYLVDHLGFTPLELTAALTVRAVSSIVIGTAFGRWIDRRPGVAPLAIALGGAALGYGALAFTTSFWAVLLISGGPVAFGAAAFPQSMALVKSNFARSNPSTANRALGVVRAAWSLAWAIGPAVGAAAVAIIGFRGILLLSAGCAASALVTLVAVGAKPEPHMTAVAHRHEEASSGGSTIALAFSAITLFHTAMFLGAIPLAIFMTGPLGGAESDVGYAFSLCAALEIVVMGALIWRPLKRGQRGAILLGFAAFVAYFVALSLARSVDFVLLAQVLRAVAIGIISYQGISFLHALLPHHPGAASALFANAGQIGSVVASLSVGLLADVFGYSSIFAVCAALSGFGFVLTFIVRPEPVDAISQGAPDGAPRTR